MSIRRGIRKLIIECCAACEASGGVCDLEMDVVEPVMDVIDDVALSFGYEPIDEEDHWEDGGRMFDYGSQKSEHLDKLASKMLKNDEKMQKLKEKRISTNFLKLF